MRRRFSEAQIRDFLRAAAAGTPVMDLCWNHCFSRSTFRAWQARYGETIDAKASRLKQLELESAHLRKALARAHSDLERSRRPSSGTAGTDERAGQPTRVAGSNRRLEVELGPPAIRVERAPPAR